MSSFNQMARIRNGFWVALRSFLLNEKRDVAKRVAVIENEVERIGNVRIVYRKITDPITKKTTTTEHREGFFVTENSSIGKLVQAYVALGGNPFDISYFFYPDLTRVEDDGSSSETYPYGGVVYPESKNYNEPVGTYKKYTGGFPKIKKHLSNRYGDRVSPNNLTDDNVNLQVHLRSWVSQEMKEKIQELEWRIIKLADLRDQLLYEKDELLQQLFGGTSNATPEFDENKYTKNLRLQDVIHAIDIAFFNKNPKGLIEDFSVDPQKVASNESFYVDVPEEIYLSLMI